MKFLATVCIALGVACGTHAQEFPAKPIKMVVPFPAGGGTDVVGRLFAQKLADLWKQPVIADNRPGANTIIGSDVVAKSPADGYTWLVASPSHTINVSLYARKTPYDAERDFAPAAMLASSPLVLLVNPSVKANTVEELITLARSKPGLLKYGSAGTGSSPHLAGAMFAQMAGIDIVHVPYKGTAPSIADLLGGHIDMTFTPVPGIQQQVDSGKLRAIAVTSNTRFAGFPKLPTIKESGLPNYAITQWWGLAVPRATPAAVIDRIEAGVKEIQKRADVQQTLAAQGAEVNAITRPQFAELVRKEIAQYRKVVEAANITPD